MAQLHNKIMSTVILALVSLAIAIVFSTLFGFLRGYSLGEYMKIITFEDLIFISLAAAILILVGAFLIKKKEQSIFNILNLKFYTKLWIFCFLFLILFGTLDRFNLF